MCIPDLTVKQCSNRIHRWLKSRRCQATFFKFYTRPKKRYSSSPEVKNVWNIASICVDYFPESGQNVAGKCILLYMTLQENFI